MNIDFKFLEIFLIFILPGLISMNVYRLLMPSRILGSNETILNGLFYSSINFAIFFPLIYLIHINNFYINHKFWYALSGLFILFVGPILWPLIYTKIVRSSSFVKKLQIPYPTSWDYFFDKRQAVFILIHLKNGNLIGGYFGPNSYAGSFPNDGDIYLEAVYSIDSNGKFKQPIKNTKGVLINKEEYSYIEIFEIPEQEGD